MLIFFLQKNSAHISGAGENHQVHAVPCAEGDFFGGSMDSVLLSETSGHYSNKRTKYEVEGLFLKPSNSHHWAVTLLQGCPSLLSTVVQAVELLHDLQHALSFGLWQHQEYKNSHGQAVCQENDETQITKSFLQESKEKKCVHKHLSWFLYLML